MDYFYFSKYDYFVVFPENDCESLMKNEVIIS